MDSYRTLPFSIFPISILLTGQLLASIALAQTEINRQVPAEASGTVEVNNIAGSVTISGWQQNEVRVTGVLGRDVQDLEINNVRGRVEIEIRQGRGHGGAAQLEVRVPMGSRILVDTVSAAVRVAGVQGGVEVETVSGSVDVEGKPSSLEVQTVSGSVEVEDVANHASIETVAGTIRLRGGRHIKASSVSGRIHLKGLNKVQSLDLGLVSGSIEIIANLAKGADINISSHNGSIDFALPASVSARFEVSSFSGRIHNELGPPARRERYSPASEVEFTTGSGEAHVQIESFSGGITLRKQ